MNTKQSQPDERQIGMSARQSFVLLALLFLAPLLVAWFVLSGGEGWRPAGTTNHGTLIQPARLMDLPGGIQDRAGKDYTKDSLRGKWTLLQVGDAGCDAVCETNLYKMRQIRLAQGEHMNRVQRLFLVRGDEIPASLNRVLSDYPDMDVVNLPAEQADHLTSLLRMDQDEGYEEDRVYLVDPLGYLMMYYQPDADPKGMLMDLKKLLKYSQIG